MIAASSSRAVNNLRFRDADASNLSMASRPLARQASPPASPGSLQRSRRGVSLMSLNSTSLQAKDVNSLRDALIRQDASMNKVSSAANHLQPADRHALMSRTHFRADPSADALAQHLRWSTMTPGSSGNIAFAETDVLTAAREAYHPIAPAAPQMQISIKQIGHSPAAKSTSTSQQSSPTPPAGSSAHSQPVLLLSKRNTSGNSARRLVSVENRPATTSAVRRSASSRQQNSSAFSAASTPRVQPGSADLKKQYDAYQRGTQFLPQSTSTKYFYKPEHGWLVKNARDRRNTISANARESNPTGTPLSQPQLVNSNNAGSTGNLNASLEISKLATPPNEHRLSSRQMGATQQQQQRLISATSLGNHKVASSAAIPYVTVVDLHGDGDFPDHPTDELPARSATAAAAARGAAVARRAPGHEARAVSSGQMIVTSKQHPAATRAKKLRDLFSSYDDFKRAAEDYANHFPKLPQDLTCSPYLNEAKQRQIWCWLHYGENISDVEYLLSVC